MVGGLGFILPAVILIIALSAVFFGETPPTWVRGAGAGAGAAVAAVAARAGTDLARPSFERARPAGVDGWSTSRWASPLPPLSGAYLVLVLLACGLAELAVPRAPGRTSAQGWAPIVAPAAALAASVGLARSPGWRSRSERCPTAAGS